ncbi:MAG: tetratricopeptide repeat protein, partial [Cyclobacteriaceae bacterium]|nr:tetratricopeptide repeat protein [Cyclobacteriaceae bacterium]
GSIQQACQNETDLKLRIGIHQGEVVSQGEDVFGSGVNIASRIEAIAPVGGIRVSDSVQRNIQNKKGIEIEFVKEETLKNVKQPVRLYEVKVNTSEIHVSQIDSSSESDRNSIVKSRRKLPFIIAIATMLIIALGYFAITRFEKGTESVTTSNNSTNTDKSIAVLPFRNDSPDPENEYFCNGMMEEILDKLHKVGDINVLSRMATEQYRNTTKGPKEIAAELGVANILEGSVRKYEDKFRINVQLIQAGTGYHLWSEVFDGELSETIFIVQSSIAEEIAQKLDAVITPFERQQIKKSSTSTYAAYEKYMRGRESLRKYWDFPEEKEAELAEKLFRESLEIDPKFAMGYAGLCRIFSDSRKRNIDSMNYYAEKVIEFDPNNGWGYAYKGIYFENRGELNKALESYDKAIEVDPKWPWFHQKKGNFLCYRKQDFITGLPYVRESLRMTIEQKGNVENSYSYIGRLFFNIGDYEKASQYFKASLEIKPRCYVTSWMGWVIFAESGYERAMDFLDSMSIVVLPCPGGFDSYRFQFHVWNKEFDRAQKNLNSRLEQGGKFGRLDTLYIVYLYQKLGNEEEASAILNRSSVNRLTENRDWVTLILMSVIHALKEEREESLQYLSDAAKLGFTGGWRGWHDLIETYPFFENFRDDPEFKAIVKRAQDEKAALRAQVREMEERGFEMDLSTTTH